MIPKSTRICISTQYPRKAGGVSREVKLISDFLYKKGYSPSLMFSSNIRKNLFFKEEFILSNKKLMKNIITTRSYLPFFWPNHKLYGLLMKKYAKDFEVCHQIGGSCFEATPFLKANKKYICWAATTFRDEWRTVSKLGDLRRPASWLFRFSNNLSIPLLAGLEKKIYKNAAIINPISTRTAEMIKKEFGINEEKIRIISPPTDFSELNKKKEVKIKPDFDYIIFVGRLDKRKNLEMLFKAFKKIRGNFPGLKTVILGDGPERKNLENLSKQLGIGKYVVFTGFVDDETKIDYISQAKLFVLPSMQEGFGIVLVEALGLGVPVVSTDCGGPSDIVENGKNGYLTKVGNHKEFGERIHELLINENLRKEFGRYGKKHVMKKFSIEHVGKRFLEEYKEILE